MIKVGIIGGSGLDEPGLIKNQTEIKIDTPYGDPSSIPAAGQIEGVDVVFISRHGKNHRFSPTQVNYRANIHALKELKTTHILATTACGSLKQEIKPGDFVIIDQFIDFTKHRKSTFFESFEKGMQHTPMGEPFDKKLRELLFKTSSDLRFKTHDSGTVITIEGPRFSTKAESKMFISWGGDIINMSISTEAALANEAEIPYAAIAMSTDYDCWKDGEEPVTWEEVLKIFNKNAEKVKQLLINAVKNIGGCHEH